MNFLPLWLRHDDMVLKGILAGLVDSLTQQQEQAQQAIEACTNCKTADWGYQAFRLASANNIYLRTALREISDRIK